MRSTGKIFILAIAALALAALPALAGGTVGDTAPAFSLKGVDEKQRCEIDIRALLLCANDFDCATLPRLWIRYGHSDNAFEVVAKVDGERWNRSQSSKVGLLPLRATRIGRPRADIRGEVADAVYARLRHEELAQARQIQPAIRDDPVARSAQPVVEVEGIDVKIRGALHRPDTQRPPGGGLAPCHRGDRGDLVLNSSPGPTIRESVPLGQRSAAHKRTTTQTAIGISARRMRAHTRRSPVGGCGAGV